MPPPGSTFLESLRFRRAEAADARAIAELHADSWRRHYRGAYSDPFLDGDVLDDRLAVWAERLSQENPRRRTIIAEDAGELVGFANTLLEQDPIWERCSTTCTWQAPTSVAGSARAC